MTFISRHRPTAIGPAVAMIGAAIGIMAVANQLVARRTTRRHPPKGSFLDVHGVRLHYTDRGTGSPIVLIHGNMVSGDDYDISGVAQLLLASHRVIVFDRPGFGHSERPRDTIWTADRQADLLHDALQQLGIDRLVVVGHSWGAIVAMAMAVRHESNVAAVVAIGGYYYPTARPDALMAAVGALPVVGDVLRNTISPLLTWLTMPLVKRALFSPGAVPDRFQAEYSTAMSARPLQIRATSEDGALMIPGAISLQGHYKDIKMPVMIVAGSGDKVVFKRRAEQLNAAVSGSVLHVVDGAGHMVHHQATRTVVDAVEAAVAASGQTLSQHAANSPAFAPASNAG